jgi:hypothetical protein
MHPKLFVYGFPGLYGGAGTELHHQIPIWQDLGLEVHLIPNNGEYQHEPLFPDMQARGVVVHECDEFSAIEPDAPVFGYCSSDFLDKIDRIRDYSTNTVFVNCMTWLFAKEKQRMAEGKIRTFIYQNESVRLQNMPALASLNTNASVNFVTVAPHFDASAFPFVEQRTTDYFGCGRMSRQDADKYSSSTLLIYEYFVAPQLKRGLFVGFDERSEAKIGKPYDWIRTAADHRECSQREFYEHCNILLQPMDTTENWPRVGLEAMASGTVLIVDNRGGWRQMVDHGVTGWLCNHERDFIYYASKMAYEPELRLEMAHRARIRGEILGGADRAKETWSAAMKVLM